MTDKEKQEYINYVEKGITPIIGVTANGPKPEDWEKEFSKPQYEGMRSAVPIEQQKEALESVGIIKDNLVAKEDNLVTKEDNVQVKSRRTKRQRKPKSIENENNTKSIEELAKEIENMKSVIDMQTEKINYIEKLAKEFLG